MINKKKEEESLPDRLSHSDKGEEPEKQKVFYVYSNKIDDKRKQYLLFW